MTVEAKKKNKQLFEVKIDGVGKQAQYLLRKKDELKDLTETVKKAETNLILELLASKRNSITLDGKIISVKHVDSKETITITSEVTKKKSFWKKRR